MPRSARLQDRSVDGGYLKPVIVTEVLEPVDAIVSGSVAIVGDVEVVQPNSTTSMEYNL